MKKLNKISSSYKNKNRVCMDRKTKNLVRRIKSTDIALIDHLDIDEVSAEAFIRKKIKVVLNTSSSITGRYPNPGPEKLLNSNVHLIDQIDSEIFNKVEEGDILEIKGANIYNNGKLIGTGRIVTKKIIKEAITMAVKNKEELLNNFVRNTLEYALREKDLILEDLVFPDIKTDIEGKHVLIVVRGANYRDDLKAILPYIKELKPIIIAVDGGGDALHEFGIPPDIIIGDMDSISDNALNRAGEIIVHAYRNGYAPGLQRIKRLGLKAEIFPAPGTSEDIALLLAYEKKAKLIVAVGTHSNMIDFLEKGRKGMASTFLVRLKVGDRLVDAKGVSQLYRQQGTIRLISILCLAALVPLFILIVLSPIVQHFFGLVLLRLRLAFF